MTFLNDFLNAASFYSPFIVVQAEGFMPLLSKRQYPFLKTKYSMKWRWSKGMLNFNGQLRIQGM